MSEQTLREQLAGLRALAQAFPHDEGDCTTQVSGPRYEHRKSQCRRCQVEEVVAAIASHPTSDSTLREGLREDRVSNLVWAMSCSVPQAWLKRGYRVETVVPAEFARKLEARIAELEATLAAHPAGVEPQPEGELQVGAEILVQAMVVDPSVKTAYRTVEIKFPHGGTNPTYVDLRDVTRIAAQPDGERRRRRSERVD